MKKVSNLTTLAMLATILFMVIASDDSRTALLYTGMSFVVAVFGGLMNEIGRILDGEEVQA